MPGTNGTVGSKLFECRDLRKEKYVVPGVAWRGGIGYNARKRGFRAIKRKLAAENALEDF